METKTLEEIEKELIVIWDELLDNKNISVEKRSQYRKTIISLMDNLENVIKESTYECTSDIVSSRKNMKKYFILTQLVNLIAISLLFINPYIGLIVMLINTFKSYKFKTNFIEENDKKTEKYEEIAQKANELLILTGNCCRRLNLEFKIDEEHNKTNPKDEIQLANNIILEYIKTGTIKEDIS